MTFNNFRFITFLGRKTWATGGRAYIVNATLYLENLSAKTLIVCTILICTIIFSNSCYFLTGNTRCSLSFLFSLVFIRDWYFHLLEIKVIFKTKHLELDINYQISVNIC